jgi:hypothetical protein
MLKKVIIFSVRPVSLIILISFLFISCTQVTVKPMLDYDGNVVTTEDGYPIPQVTSKSMGQDREISIWFSRLADGSIQAHYQRKDTDHSVELMTVVKDGIVEGIKLGAAAGAASTVVP